MHPKTHAMPDVSEPALSSADRALVAAALEIIRLRHVRDKHHVGAALRTTDGRIFTGVHLETYVGRLAVCAEAVALGAAATAGVTSIDTIVSARYTGEIVSPCGACRELISDFSPDAKVIVPGETGCLVVPVSALLVHKYRKRLKAPPSTPGT